MTNPDTVRPGRVSIVPNGRALFVLDVMIVRPPISTLSPSTARDCRTVTMPLPAFGKKLLRTMRPQPARVTRG